jgi:hypothetical protein
VQDSSLETGCTCDAFVATEPIVVSGTTSYISSDSNSDVSIPYLCPSTGNDVAVNEFRVNF